MASPNRAVRVIFIRDEPYYASTWGSIIFKGWGFSYTHLKPKVDRQTGSILGMPLRREYPGLVEEYIGPENCKTKRLAMSWSQYLGKKDMNGLTAGDRVKDEFWAV